MSLNGAGAVIEWAVNRAVKFRWKENPGVLKTFCQSPARQFLKRRLRNGQPVTLGALVASALAMGAEAAMKGAVGEAGKEAYQTLKRKIAQWAGQDLDLLEIDPASKGRQTVVAEKDRSSIRS